MPISDPDRRREVNRQASLKYYNRKKQENPEHFNEKMRARSLERRQRVIAAYGGCCSCCGESAFEFLAIDHINGKEQREIDGYRQAAALVMWLIKHNFPEGYRILCHNCNCAIGFYAVCPHEVQIT